VHFPRTLLLMGFSFVASIVNSAITIPKPLL
jgi:hypothetical protein